MNLLRKLRQRAHDLLPIAGFHFDHPIVLLQSDDWGRVGVRDCEGLEQLQSAGVHLGDRPYDLYTLETAEDVVALTTLLKKHRDSTGNSPCLEMNFVPLNLDFTRMKADDFRVIHLRPVSDGLPEGWKRPSLIDSYRQGIADGVLSTALHGGTHFCRQAVERALKQNDENAKLLRTLWRAGTPYIHWRMPWIGYEYWDPGQSDDDQFLPEALQRELIGQTIGAFAKLFSSLPHSACAPGYRANDDTHRAWAQHGIRVAQNGPGAAMPPHFDRHELLHLYRTVEFEPATAADFSVDLCVRRAETCFQQGLPAVVSIHSINFHSTLRDFRSQTLGFLDEFLIALETRHSGLLYLRDEDIFELVTKGSCAGKSGTVQVGVMRKNFRKGNLAPRGEA
ncbi:MAG TPA: hypothetical protein VMH04_08630 [Candidatus Solibacter sp.]|nr:hypothetical protein [Candidatus Solibacter sp.]